MSGISRDVIDDESLNEILSDDDFFNECEVKKSEDDFFSDVSSINFEEDFQNNKKEIINIDAPTDLIELEVPKKKKRNKEDLDKTPLPIFECIYCSNEELVFKHMSREIISNNYLYDCSYWDYSKLNTCISIYNTNKQNTTKDKKVLYLIDFIDNHTEYLNKYIINIQEELTNCIKNKNLLQIQNQPSLRYKLKINKKPIIEPNIMIKRIEIETVEKVEVEIVESKNEEIPQILQIPQSPHIPQEEFENFLDFSLDEENNPRKRLEDISWETEIQDIWNPNFSNDSDSSCNEFKKQKAENISKSNLNETSNLTKNIFDTNSDCNIKQNKLNNISLQFKTAISNDSETIINEVNTNISVVLNRTENFIKLKPKNKENNNTSNNLNLVDLKKDNLNLQEQTRNFINKNNLNLKYNNIPYSPKFQVESTIKNKFLMSNLNLLNKSSDIKDIKLKLTNFKTVNSESISNKKVLSNASKYTPKKLIMSNTKMSCDLSPSKLTISYMDKSNKKNRHKNFSEFTNKLNNYMNRSESINKNICSDRSHKLSGMNLKYNTYTRNSDNSSISSPQLVKSNLDKSLGYSKYSASKCLFPEKKDSTTGNYLISSTNDSLIFNKTSKLKFYFRYKFFYELFVDEL